MLRQGCKKCVKTCSYSQSSVYECLQESQCRASAETNNTYAKQNVGNKVAHKM